MNSTAKLHLGSALYCALLVGLNWFRSVEYARPIGVTSETFAPIALALLISAAVAVYLLYRCVRSSLSLLESGRKVRAGRWIESWSVTIYALPLLWHRTSISSWTEADGALATASGGFGHTLSGWVFLLATLGLLLFQILARLVGDDEGPNQRPLPARLARG